jgi:Icc-related predicted phosphoesterase
MKVAAISDLHGMLPLYPSDYWKDLNDCEILFICGDILPLRIQFDMVESKRWLIEEFKMWASDLPVEKVYIIAGNHDAWFERNDVLAHSIFSKYDKVTYLKNEYVDYISNQDSKVYRIFGTPYCHIFGNWPFMRDEETLAKKFSQIPGNVDILISHDAPYGTSDVCFEGWAADGRHKGCPELRDAIIASKPRYNFHGHLHSTNHGEELLGDTKVYNVSILNESYDFVYDPLIIRV